MDPDCFEGFGFSWRLSTRPLFRTLIEFTFAIERRFRRLGEPGHALAATNG
jgi:hypothetical protein